MGKRRLTGKPRKKAPCRREIPGEHAVEQERRGRVRKAVRRAQREIRGFQTFEKMGHAENPAEKERREATAQLRKDENPREGTST